MFQKICYLILLICLSGCIPKGFIILDEAEEASDGPQLTITVSPDPALPEEMITVAVVSDRLLVDAPTVLIVQHYEKRGTDITNTLETMDQLTWQGTYTIKSGYDGTALVKVFNALDEEGNKSYGTTSFEVAEAEAVAEVGAAEEIPSEEMTIEYENVQWHDIRGEYGVSRAPMLTNQEISNNISCIAEDEERLWFGTNYGIGQYDKLTQDWKGFLNKKGGISNSIHCMAMDDDFVWFGSQGDGLFRYQNSTDKWLAFPADNKCHDPNINDILIVNDLVWVATNRGLAKYDKLSLQWTAYTFQTTYDQLISEKITKLAWLYPYFWIGTDKGLMSYDSLSDVWQDRTAICSKNITSLFMDKNYLWIGTPDSGVIQYNTTANATRTYTVSNGLYSNGVLSLAVDTSHVFVGHSGGISEFDKSNNTWMSFTQTKIGDIFRPLDSVQAVYLENDGNPWIGMNSGLIDISQSELMEAIEPTIIELIPAMNTILSTGFPEITAKYEDNIGGSGIDSLAVWLVIDGEQVYGTATTQEFYYKPMTPLTEGEHSLEIQVTDKCGNIATRKNTFNIALPKLSYKLLVSQAFVKSGQEISVTIDASEELIGTPTALLSFASVTTSLFENTTDGTSVSAPDLIENGTETGTWTSFGSWETKNRKQWRGTVKLPINVLGTGIVTIEGLEDIHGQKPKDFPVARVMAINKENAGIIAPRIISMATATIAGTTTNILTGTATPGSFVNLMVDGKVVRTVMADAAGNFAFKNISNVMLKTGTATTIIISSTDRAKITSNVSETMITPDLNMLIDFPKMASNTVNVRGVARQTIGTISGYVAYGSMSVPLSMAIVNGADATGGMGWMGNASILAKIDGVGTITIIATDSSGQQATFTSMLRIDTIPPGTPTITIERMPTSGWIIHGTATKTMMVELWTDKGLAGTITPSLSSTFTVKANPKMILSGTTTLWAVNVDKAGNRALSENVIIYPPLRIFAKLPQLVNTLFDVGGVASQAIGTISGELMYDNGSVSLNMAIVNITSNNDWVGSASIPVGVEGVGTVSIVAVDTYGQRAEVISTLSIDTIPPETPIIAATNTATNGWVIYGTATDAVIVELYVNENPYGTTTPSAEGTFGFSLRSSNATITVFVISMDQAGNQAKSEPLYIYPSPLQLAAPSVPTTTGISIRSENGGTIIISGKFGQTTLKISPDALFENSQVTLTNILKSTGKLAVANFNIRQEKNITPVPDSYRSLVCTNQANGKPVSSTKQAMQLCIPYGDDNHDGIVDETTIRVETLKIFKLNEVSNRWDMITDSYPVNTKYEVRANIYEFGVYAIMSYEPVYSLDDVKVYPNPFYPNMNQKCKFSPLPSGRLTISIYNSAGEQVRVLRQHSNEAMEWDGNNDHDDAVASGIYFYLIKNADGKRTGKIGLIR